MTDTTETPSIVRPWVIEILKVHGLPTVILLMLLYGGWRSVQWSADNVVRPLVARQILLMDAIEVAVTAQNTMLTDVHNLVKRIAETNDVKLKAIEDNQQAICEMLKEMRKHNP